MRKCFLPAICIILASVPLHAAGPPKSAPATWMLKPGKTLVSDDLGQPFSKDWIDGKGKWQVVDGAMRGAELKSDEHGAVKRRPVKFGSAVIAFAFKLEGAKTISVSVNAAKGHLCRVQITPTGFTAIRDKDKKSGEKRVVLDTCKVTIAPNEWHTMVVEIHGKELLVRMDNKHVAYGEHKELAVAKANVGFTVAGESASFKNFVVYEATPAPGWDLQKAKLLETRKK